MLQEVAQALAYAHARGVVHRDIKPDNIMLDRASGRALVTDFGIAKAQGDDTNLTQPGAIVGTARYMAPEQALAEGRLDWRADLYALGLVGYFMLSGSHAIQGTTLPAVIAEHARGRRIDLAQLQRRVPRPLADALARCLAPRPADRYERTEDLAEALQQLGGDLPDTPPAIRTFFRETERAFFFTLVLGNGLWLVRVENVPAAFLLLVGGTILAQWTVSLERASRLGITWSMIRRAIYVERARRLEEMRLTVGKWLTPAAGLAMLLAFGGALALRGKAPRGGGSIVNDVVQWVVIFGNLAVLRVFGLHRLREAGLRRSQRHRWQMLLSFLLVAIGVAIGAGALGNPGNPRTSGWILPPAVLSTLLAVAGALLFWRWWRGREPDMDAPPPLAMDDPSVLEWRMPRWLDTIGSWLFGRFVRVGWGIRFERDRPAAAGPALDVREARLLEQRIERLGDRYSATGRAGEAAGLAHVLAHECRVAAQRLEPLAGKLARLNEGVLVSQTAGLGRGESLEGELDRVEGEADAVRAEVAGYLEVLRALAADLEAGGAAGRGEGATLDAALARARALSSAVRERIEVLAKRAPSAPAHS